MLGLLTAVLVAAPQNILAVHSGNALTLPAARHLVRLDPGGGRPATWLLAVQQDGTDGHRLSMYRSDDEARSWRWYAPIQDACCHRDTPDLVPVGRDIAMVFSYEGPQISGSAEHDVWFQWWRWDGNADWKPQAKVRVFDSTSGSTAYLRGELARDSLGRLWVWAQRLNSDGSFTMVMSVSTDGGASFQAQPSLDNFSNRPGGRILPIGGGRLMLLYGAHGGSAGYMRIRSDSDPLSSWSARELVFPEGIYHGAALSAAGDGSGGVHLVYKDSPQHLFYRHWSGSWSARQTIESSGDWAVQPAITRVGGSLVIFWNKVLSTNTNYQFYWRVLAGGSLGSTHLVDGSSGFKGYPASAESLPGGIDVPCMFGKTPDASTGGNIALVFAPSPAGSPLPQPPPSSDAGVPDAGAPDAGTPDAGAPDAGAPDGGVPDAGIPDAGTPDAGAPDAGTPDAGPAPQAGVLFSDDFNRTLSSGLGPAWTIVSGGWRDDGRANSDRSTLDRASVAGVSCADCRIDARMVNYAGGESMLELRSSGPDRYALALTASGKLEIRRYRAGIATVLGSASSGIADLKSFHSFSFVAQGAPIVTLTAWVDGAPRLSATDATASAVTSAGAAGIAATASGILFDDFVLSGIGSVATPPPPADADTPDAGAPDAGPVDAGEPDAGAPDAGPPDAGAPAGGGTIAVTVTYTETRFDLLAVDPSGTAYGVNLGVSPSQIWATVDGRAWSKRGATPDGARFSVMTALSDGTLIADVSGSAGHALARSTDHGATWTTVLKTDPYRMLTPHSIAELDGAVYFAEYQAFTSSSTPIRLWKSEDQGRTWIVQHTFEGHRHAHGLAADPARHALWVYFGDRDVQSGAYRSTDGGTSWTAVVNGKEGDIVDAVVLPDGSLLCGQDISYLPRRPNAVRIGMDGAMQHFATLPSASYSTHAISTGGFVIGTTYEVDSDVSPSGWTRGSLWGSGDGAEWKKLLDVPRLSSTENVRTDVYWELATGELVVSVRNAAGFGPGGRGYMLLHTVRQ